MYIRRFAWNTASPSERGHYRLIRENLTNCGIRVEREDETATTRARGARGGRRVFCKVIRRTNQDVHTRGKSWRSREGALIFGEWPSPRLSDYRPNIYTPILPGLKISPARATGPWPSPTLCEECAQWRLEKMKECRRTSGYVPRIVAVKSCPKACDYW